MPHTANHAPPDVKAVLKDGMTIALGGFGLCGMPTDLVPLIRDSGVKHLTVVTNTFGIDGRGPSLLLENGQVDKVVASYIGGNQLCTQMYLDGELEVEFVPQGTLVERLRAGGSGIPAFYTRAGVGTQVAEGKETAEFEGVTYLMERAIVPDLSLVRAHVADTRNNLAYRLTARNFNPAVAMAGRVTWAESEEFVEVGQLSPDQIQTPGVYVKAIIPAVTPNPIEILSFRPRPDAA